MVGYVRVLFCKDIPLVCCKFVSLHLDNFSMEFYALNIVSSCIIMNKKQYLGIFGFTWSIVDRRMPPLPFVPGQHFLWLMAGCKPMGTKSEQVHQQEFL